MNMPKVTVLMSVYNGEKYLKEAIDSILAQTFRDFEFLIINDASTDSTKSIILSCHDPRIRYIENEANIGLTRSLNKGISLAKGEYIARMDADDVSLPARLEKQVQFLDSREGVGLLGTSWLSINDVGLLLSVNKACGGAYAAHSMCHGSVMIRKSTLEKAGGYRPCFKYAQDYDLWLRLSEVCEADNLSETLYKLRLHSGSISSLRQAEQNMAASLALSMAEERKKYGRDRLSAVTAAEAENIVRQKLALKGFGYRKALSYMFLIWGNAALDLNYPRDAYHNAKSALRANPLNFKAVLLWVKAFIAILISRIRRKSDMQRGAERKA